MSAAARALVLRRDIPEAWVWMPAFLLRIQRFVVEHDTAEAAEAAWLRDQFSRCFGAGDGRMLGILALVDGAAVGHMLAGVETLAGQRVGWVYQVEHEGFTDQGLAALCQVLLERWAAGLGLERLAGLAASESRASRYEVLGWVRGGRFMRKAVEVQDELSLRGRRLVDDRETGDPSGAATADPADH